MWNYDEKILGKRLKSLREQNQITQEELAKILDIDSSTIANYENGNRQPKYHTLVNIADYFGISIDWLIGRTSNPQISSIALAVEGLEPRVQKVLLEDKNNALPFLSLVADCLESGYSIEQVRELLKNIFIIRKNIQNMNQ